jgi:hypothetical protein
MNTEPLKVYKWPTYRVELYENRIEIVYLGGGLFGHREIIAIRNISDVKKPPLLNCVDVVTNDRKKHRIVVSALPGPTEEFRQLLMSLL